MKHFLNSTTFKVLLHITGWVFFLSLPLLFFHFPRHSSYEVVFYLLAVILTFYTNTLVLIPKFLSRGKTKLYLFMIAVFLIVIFITANSAHVIINKLGSEEMRNKPQNQRILTYIRNIKNSSVEIDEDEFLEKINEFKEESKMPLPARTTIAIIFVLGISTSLKVTQEWRKNEKEKKEIENEKLNTELTFLKSQVNPHFLFNTLNSIYSLANKRSEKTSEAVVKLSNILRYMLYSTDQKTVNLEEEIQYLTDYIDLQRLRLYDNTKINIEINGDVIAKPIAPMLLVPLVENAFKHGIDNTTDCFIRIYIQVENFDLTFKVENSIPFKGESSKDKNSGIGLQNLKRRLNLLYPDNHLLLIDESDNLFVVKLSLRLLQ